MTCKHCGLPIEVDQGELEWMGRTQYFHPDLVDGAIDALNDGVTCADGENEAEPA